MSRPRLRRSITSADTKYEISICDLGHIHLDIGGEDGNSFSFASPEDAYDLAQALLRGYDEINGIAQRN